MTPKSDQSRSAPDPSGKRQGVPTFKQYTGRPNLVRTSSLDPHYIRQNLSLVNTPVKLIFDKDLSAMTDNWTLEEKEQQRRLVKFNFIRLSPSEYFVQFDPIKKEQYDHTSPIISCIFWKEKDLHIVTSVDIILILEYLVQESFSIEEKNRIRRNLQSLKPQTISRTNKQFERFFKLLMSMEDPRPRNIEQDLKVFRWSDLFKAINKVISKYSMVDDSMPLQTLTEPSAPAGEQPPQFFASPRTSLSGMSGRATPATSASDSLASAISAAGPSPHPHSTAERFNPRNNNSSNVVIDNSPSAPSYRNHAIRHSSASAPDSHGSQLLDSNSQPVFLPSERLKVLKRKLNKSSQSSTPSAYPPAVPAPNYRNDLFQHALKPSDPVPLDSAAGVSNNKEDDIIVKSEDDSPESVDSPPDPNSVNPERNSQASLGGKSDDSTISGPSESTSSNDESAGSTSISNPSSRSLPSNGSNSAAASSTSQSDGPSSANVLSNTSQQDSSNTSGGNSAGTLNKSKRTLGLAADENLKAPKPVKQRSKLEKATKRSERNDNIKKYAEDQSNRVFGGNQYDENHIQTQQDEGYDSKRLQPGPHSNHYYQYPQTSMLYSNKPQEPFSNHPSWSPKEVGQGVPSLTQLSTSNVEKHDLEQRQKHEDGTKLPRIPSISKSFGGHNPKSVRLSSIGESLSNTDNNSIRLPPILSRGSISETGTSGVKLPGPSKINEYWKNFGPSSVTSNSSEPYSRHMRVATPSNSEPGVSKYSGSHTFSPMESGYAFEQPPHKVQATDSQKESQAKHN